MSSDGLRTYKKVGSTVHEYEYSGGKLFYEKRGDIQFYYRYDALGNLATITRIKADGEIFNGYVICNSRGDVEEIRYSSGEPYARYVYDSWGKTDKILDANGQEISSDTHLAVQNPIRYRGYYWDSETGLYYLQSRYYDPVVGRFVNADSLVDTSDVLGFNMYAYCGNNPVNNIDPTGHFAESVKSFFKKIWNEICSFFRKAQDNVSYGGIDYDAYEEQYDNTPRYDRSVNGDRQKGARKQINDAWGKDKAGREKNSKEHHKYKKKTGRGGNDNLPYSDLLDGDYVEEVAILGSGAVAVWILLNDFTGIGVADDVALGPVITVFFESVRAAYG